MTHPIETRPTRSETNTTLAFLLAPGIAALAGAAVVSCMLLLDPTTPRGAVAALVAAFMFFGTAFGLVGYLTAALIAVPIFLMLPEKARQCFAAVVPLAGAIAAAPWLPVAAPWRNGRADLSFLAVPFGLGVVAGVAFLFLRRTTEPDALGSMRDDPGPVSAP